MRLTLRTMLAYLDDILEPADAEQLGQKIEESKFASELVDRIRSSTRRLRLGAPRLDGKGMAADANTVAEYLDNVMPPDKVPEFERVCLESDIHLAEVTSAHQVLTLVLGEPALFDAGIRERMYRIGHSDAALSHGAASPDGNGSGGAAEMSRAVASTPLETSPLADVTMTLPRPKSRGAKTRAAGRYPYPIIGLMLLLGFAIPILVLLALGEFGPNHPVVHFFYGPRDTAQSDDGQKIVDSQSAAGETRTGTGSVDGQAATQSNSGASVGNAAAEQSSVDVRTPPSKQEAPAEQDRPQQLPAAEPPNVADAASAGDVRDTRPASPRQPIEGVAAGGKPEPTPPAAGAARDPFSGAPVATPGNQIPGAVAAPTASGPPGASPVPSTPTVSAPPPPAPMPPGGESPAAPINAGMFLSEDQVLARLDETDSAWVVLPANTPLIAGEELLSLPTYRPQVLISPSVNLTLAGNSSLKLHVSDATNLPRIAIRFGRATVVPVREMGASVKIDVAGRSGVLTFTDVESSAAIEVQVFLPPGANPLESTAHVIVHLWASSGSMEWHEVDRAPVKLPAGKVASFLDEAEMTIADATTFPNWIDGKNLSDIDRRASQELRKFLTAERPLSRSLMEQTNSRQVEVRSLACRALCSLDIFEPALESLADDMQRSYWHAQLDAIHSQMALGGHSARELSTAISKLYSEDANSVFRLIQGYSPEQLSGGGAAELVDALSHPSMTIRVLAYENLRNITGKTYPFRPDARPEMEKSKVLKWCKVLEDGQITYSAPPALNTPPPSLAPPESTKPAINNK